MLRRGHCRYIAANVFALLLVMSAGGYRFTDFMRVGVPLTLIVWAVLSWLLPTLYGLA
jgi:di/tricarboxylate transporter